MTLLLVASPDAAARPRDTVFATPEAGAARIAAAADVSRYPLGDGSGASVAVAVTPACRTSCTAADPAAIAAFLGTLVHGAEIGRLTVQLDTPAQLTYECGYGAAACYYGAERKIVLSGNDDSAPDGASREYVLAHEYGHHLARQRRTPAPFPPAIDWGTARWSSYENVCRQTRAKRVFPGNEGLHYFRDPGEAFAESFARMRFPDSGVPWRWLRTLEPDARAFEAIRADALEPWTGRTPLRLRGRVPGRGRGAALRTLRTPLDGTVSLRPAAGRGLALDLLNPTGRLLRSSRHGFSFRHRLNFTVCGQSRLRLAIRSRAPRGRAFKLQIQRP